MIVSSAPGGLFRKSVRERDLDNFLVDELQASDAFRAWLLDRLPDDFRPPTAADVRVQMSPPRADGRQTEVRLGWFAEHRLVACVLIESKVTSGFQSPWRTLFSDFELATARRRLKGWPLLGAIQA